MNTLMALVIPSILIQRAYQQANPKERNVTKTTIVIRLGLVTRGFKRMFLTQWFAEVPLKGILSDQQFCSKSQLSWCLFLNCFTDFKSIILCLFWMLGVFASAVLGFQISRALPSLFCTQYLMGNYDAISWLDIFLNTLCIAWIQRYNSASSRLELIFQMRLYSSNKKYHLP